MSRLVPYLVTPEPKRIARFIGGLAPEIKASVKASRPATFRSVADISLSLTLDAVRQRSLRNKEAEKRKREDETSRRSSKKHRGNGDNKRGRSQGRMGNSLVRSPSARLARDITLESVGSSQTHRLSRSRMLAGCASPRTTKL